MLNFTTLKAWKLNFQSSLHSFYAELLSYKKYRHRSKIL